MLESGRANFDQISPSGHRYGVSHPSVVGIDTAIGARRNDILVLVGEGPLGVEIRDFRAAGRREIDAGCAGIGQSRMAKSRRRRVRRYGHIHLRP